MILAEFVIVWNGNQAHESPIFLRPIRFLIDVGRISVDELGPATMFTDTGVVQM